MSNALRVTFNTPEGTFEVDSDVFDVARRVQEGDPTCFWGGDRRMQTCFRKSTGCYEIWRLGADGVDRWVMTIPPDQFDSRVLRRLAENDTWTRPVLEKMRKHNDHLDRKQNETLRDIEREAKTFIKWANYRLYGDGNGEEPGWRPM